MLLRCCEVVFVLNILVNCDDSVIKNKGTKYRTDILKNISLANKALQKLIENYERLQKRDNSDEVLQNYETTENDGKFKILLYDNQKLKQRNRSYKKPGNISPSTFRPGTVGIYESRSLEEVSKDVSDHHKNKAKLQSIIKNIIKDDNNIRNDKDSIDEVSSEYDDLEDIEEISIQMPPKTDVTKPNKIVLGEKNKVMKSKKKPKVIQNIFGEKTRFSVQRFDHLNKTKNRLLRIFESPLKIKSNSRRIKKIIYSETFSPNNIWQEIISKPIKLNQETDLYMNKNDEPQFRSGNDDKVTIVIFTKNMDGTLKDEFIKNNLENIVLRNSYGETCLQVPIKKCDKVIKEVSKKMCKRYKCKSEFKTDFVNNGKIGCKEQFLYKKPYKGNKKKETKEEKIEPLFSGEVKHGDSIFSRDQGKLKDNLHKNMVESNIITLRNDTLESLPKHTSLRDKYETECQQESREKCIKACEYATEETCSEHSCKGKKKKAFKTSCTDECNKVFIVQKVSSSGSSGSSDSDSDSS